MTSSIRRALSTSAAIASTCRWRSAISPAKTAVSAALSGLPRVAAALASGAAAGCACRAGVERRHIAAARQFDHHRIVAARSAIVARQRAAQPAGFDAHDGIGLRIEAFAASERLRANRVALDAVAVAGERHLHHETQEGGEPRRRAECGAGDDVFEFVADVLCVFVADVWPKSRCRLRRASR